MELNLVIRYANNMPYLAYFQEFGEEVYVWTHKDATEEEIIDKLFKKIVLIFKAKAAETEFLNRKDKVVKTIYLCKQ